MKAVRAVFLAGVEALQLKNCAPFDLLIGGVKFEQIDRQSGPPPLLFLEAVVEPYRAGFRVVDKIVFDGICIRPQHRAVPAGAFCVAVTVHTTRKEVIPLEPKQRKKRLGQKMIDIELRLAQGAITIRAITGLLRRPDVFVKKRREGPALVAPMVERICGGHLLMNHPVAPLLVKGHPKRRLRLPRKRTHKI